LIFDVYLVWSLELKSISAFAIWLIITFAALSEVYHGRNRLITATVALACFIGILGFYDLDWRTSVYVVSCYTGLLYILFKFERWLVQEITAVLQAETEKKDLEGEAELLRRESTVGAQTRTICHEVNNILCVIKGSNDLLKLKKNLQPQAVEDLIERIDRSVNKLSRLSTLVMDDLGGNSLQARRYPLAEFFADMEMLLVRHFQQDNKVRFELNLQRDHVSNELAILEKPGATYLIIHNLVKNAYEALTENGVHDAKITLSATLVDNSLHMIVGDNGPGLPAEVKAAMEAGKGLTTRRKGHGLGLKFILDQIDQAKIGFKIDSYEQTGTCFTLTIPLEQPIDHLKVA
jgi:signal transduction histidine kinase